MESRAIAVADIFDALSAKRPYRDAVPLEKVFQIMSADVPDKLDPDCFAALQQIAKPAGETTTIN